jgi:hypothetical protein
MYMSRQLGIRLFALAILMTLSNCKSSEGYEYDEGLAGPAFTGAWVYDTGTLCTVGDATMHCCPAGMAMVGVHVADNVFKCAQLTAPRGNQLLDVDTSRNGMRACPSGSVMVGLHVHNDQLACQRLDAAFPVAHADATSGTMDSYPMHVCPRGRAMSGIHPSDNVLACDS